MTAATVSARLIGDEGKPAEGHLVRVQIFELENNRWTTLASGRSDAKGNIRMDLDRLEDTETTAPALRLIEDGKPATRVLASGPLFKYDKTKRMLSVDFGIIERLDDTAFRRPGTSTATASPPAYVAGTPYRPEISSAVIGRAVKRNPGIAAVAASTRTARPAVVLDDDSRVTVAATDAAIGSALAVSREVETLRKREIELNSVLLDKDRELSAKEALIAAERTRAEKAEADTRRFQEAAEIAAAKEAEARKIAEAKVAEADRDRDAGNDALLSATKVVAETDVGDVFSNIGSRLGTANLKLQTSESPFRLGAVKLDLRGTLSDDGRKIALGAPVKDGEASRVSADLIPEDATRHETSATVPDVTGLTETAARRVLASVGLKLTTARQSVAPGSGTPGQALTQHPAPGAQVGHGEAVLVVFAVAQSNGDTPS